MGGMKITKTGDWAKGYRALDNRIRRAAVSQGIREQLTFFKGKVSEAFETSGQSNGRPWPSNKNGGKPFEGSTIAKAVQFNHPPGALKGYVYIPLGFKFRSMGKGSKGSSMRALMAHENGAIISVPVTAALLRTLHGLRRAGKITSSGSGQKLQVGGTLIIRLPRRSFLADTLAAHGGEKARTRMVRSLHVHMSAGWMKTQ